MKFTLDRYLWPILSVFVSLIFGTFNFLATRRIGKEVHPSVKTMYVGIISLVLSFVGLLIYKPSFYSFWTLQYTLGQFGIIILNSAIFWVTQSSLSISLENLQAATVATFMYISVIVIYICRRMFKV